MIELGGNIVLKGFKERDYAELIVVKKLVGRYARQLTDHGKEIKTLEVSLRSHEKGASSLFEIDAHISVGEGSFAASATDRNLFVCLDSALKKLTAQLP
ncbi:hypothetical protein D6789_03545 [Candidatus Woesearchaeota archaeon]|nr:MAG: hypothetical protein D6789_03545 [Candidatus Woesearchaeota archaeon]